MSTIKDLLDQEVLTEDFKESLLGDLEESEVNKDLSLEATVQIASILSKMSTLDSQDTVLYKKEEAISKERERISEKQSKLLKALKFQLKAGKGTKKKNTTKLGNILQSVSKLHFSD